MCQRPGNDYRLLVNRKVAHGGKNQHENVGSPARRSTVKDINIPTNTSDAYCVPGTVQISAVGDR